MRKLRYHVVCSLDGFIAGPNGEYDWIPEDPTIDLETFSSQFDTYLLGRRTFEAMIAQGPNVLAGQRVFVASRTLDPLKFPDVTVISSELEGRLADLKLEDGKDIWLFGGGSLFRSLLDAGLVDTVEVAVAPVLLGSGTPLVADGNPYAGLRLTAMRSFPSGIVWLAYQVEK